LAFAMATFSFQEFHGARPVPMIVVRFLAPQQPGRGSPERQVFVYGWRRASLDSAIAAPASRASPPRTAR
jgi:hypothetical protein